MLYLFVLPTAVLLSALITLQGARCDLFDDVFNSSDEKSISSSMDSAFGRLRSELGPLLHGPVSAPNEYLVKFWCRNSTSKSTQVFQNDQLLFWKIDFRKPYTFIIHGWLDDSSNVWVQQMTQDIFKITDNNVCLVDWKQLARYNYYQTVTDHTRVVSKYLAKFLTDLQKKGLNLDRVTLVGNNMGAHIAGQTGSTLEGKISQIYGLDPPGPLFTYANGNRGLEFRLDAKDAAYVQTIITSKDALGQVAGEGLENFYPNGGMSQANCPIPDSTEFDLVNRIACSQWQATEIFRQSLDPTNGYRARRCGDWLSYVAGFCDYNQINDLGIRSHRIGGDFYLRVYPTMPNFPAFSSHAH